MLLKDSGIKKQVTVVSQILFQIPKDGGRGIGLNI